MPPEPSSPVPTVPQPQEVEVWWGGYALRAILPSVLVCIGLSAAIVVTAFYLYDEHGVRARLARWLTYHLNALLWLYHLLRWSYRLAGYNYRLTTRRLFCWWGLWARSVPPIELADIEVVRVRQSVLERQLGIGRVVVQARGRREPLELLGLDQPHGVAELIRDTRRKAH